MAKPKLALIPAAQGTSLYSVLPSSGVGDFDFTRSGSATRINSQGLIETVASGVSRLNYPLIDGVVKGCPHHILEPVKTNVLQRSEEFDNAYWVNNGITINSNQTISPSGDLSADLLTGVSGGFGVIRFSTWSATNKVASCFAKKGSSNIFKISNASISYIGVQFDLENGTVANEDSGFEGSIENYGNGWYRCTAIDTLARSGTFSLGVNAASESIYIWGAQLESDYKTSYIPTTTAAVTRSAETANGSGDAATFNDSEGVFMAELLWTATSSNIYISIDDNTSNNRILIYSTSTDDIKALVGSGGSTQVAFTATNQDPTTFSKVAIKYKENDFALWINGIKLLTDTVGSTPIGLSNCGFRAGGGTTPFNGSAKQVQYYDSVLNDSDLEKLTSWVSFTDMAEGQLYTIE